MLFLNKDLIQISGISAPTFYRRLNRLRSNGLIDFKKDYYIDLETATKMAELIGFKDKFEKHIADAK